MDPHGAWKRPKTRKPDTKRKAEAIERLTAEIIVPASDLWPDPLAGPDWVMSFLATLRRCGNVGEALRRSGATRKQYERLLETNEQFKDSFRLALQDALDGLEKIAWDRAVDYSDALLMFLLRNYRPERFAADRVTGASVVAQNQQVVVILPDNKRGDGPQYAGETDKALEGVSRPAPEEV